MKLQPDETSLNGRWIVENKRARNDAVADRIEWLITNHLKRLTTAYDGWDTLYQDPDDGRFWEQTYPHSYMHGGGPMSLSMIAEADARTKYPAW